MIEQRELGGFDVGCDDCSNADEFETETFGDCVKEMKYAGWKIRKTDDGYKHLCPACVEENAF